MDSKIRFVLVEPSHPGNIGAAARALKVMSWKRLCLVNPKNFPSVTATARAAGAYDLLEQAVVFKTLPEALKGTTLVVGASVRDRNLPLPKITPRDLVSLFQQEGLQETAFLFGRESNGLTNQELSYCHYQLVIPANPNYSSLNVAAAIQIVAYELYALRDQPIVGKSEQIASIEEYQTFYHYLGDWLGKLNFSHPKVIFKVKRIFNRSRLTHQEIQLLMGIFKRLSEYKL